MTYLKNLFSIEAGKDKAKMKRQHIIVVTVVPNHIGCHAMKAEGIGDLRELGKLAGYSC